MGAAQSIPLVGETVTAIDCGMKLLVSGACAAAGNITGNEDLKNTASKFLNDAGQTWVEYYERNIIVVLIRAGRHAIFGGKDSETKEVKRVLKKMASSVEEVADNTPVIGHAKGAVHYIAGNTEHSYKCMKGSTRPLVVLCAGALSGGLGLGVAVGGALCGALGGITYDGAVTLYEDHSYGVWKATSTFVESIKERKSYESLCSALDVVYTIGGDACAGASAAKMVDRIRAKNQKSALENKVGKEAAQDHVDAAKKLETVTEGVDGDNHVCTKAKNLDTGKAEYGVNERCRQQSRVNEFKKKGEASGYKSSTNARKGHAGEFPKAPGVLEKAAKKQNIKINPISGRSPQACAEHHAFNKLGTHGGANNVSTSSVMKTAEGYKAVERCGNCKQYGNLMGEVASDQIHGMPVPTKEFSFCPVAEGAAGVPAHTGCGVNGATIAASPVIPTAWVQHVSIKLQVVLIIRTKTRIFLSNLVVSKTYCEFSR